MALAPDLSIKKITVVIPTYNERENIGPLSTDILSLNLPIDILVVDDASPDGTADAVEEMNDDRVKVIRREGKRGYGRAVLEGFSHALDSGADLILGMDADYSHDPQTIPRLVEKASDYDLVIGSRYCPDGGAINWPLHRMALSRTANHYVRLVLGLDIRDCTSGFRCYNRALLERIDLESVRSEGYSFLVELLYRCHLAGAAIVEEPILFKDRIKGKSKISSKEIYRSIFTVVWLKGSLRKP